MRNLLVLKNILNCNFIKTVAKDLIRDSPTNITEKNPAKQYMHSAMSMFTKFHFYTILIRHQLYFLQHHLYRLLHH